MNQNETIFHMHVDKGGHFNEGKERFDCPACGQPTMAVTDCSAPSPINGSYVVTWECQNRDCEHTQSAAY